MSRKVLTFLSSTFLVLKKMNLPVYYEKEHVRLKTCFVWFALRLCSHFFS